MNWNDGFTARYYLAQVELTTWRDIATYDLKGGQITRTGDTLLESADVDTQGLSFTGEMWVRIWLDARQASGGERTALFTGLLQAPATEWSGRIRTNKAECYSVLKPAADVLLPRGWYAVAGMDGARQAADLLKGFAPVSYANDAPKLADYIVAEDGETKLSMAHKIVNAIGWHIRISGMGEIYIEPYSTEPVTRFSSIDEDVVELDITDSRDWYSCPNVFRAISGDLIAVYKDETGGSLSIDARGREIWAEETNVTLSEDESISAYSIRRLAELQAPSRQISYKRRYRPNVLVGDAAEFNFPQQNIIGNFRITSQRIDLGYGATVQEEAIEI